MLPVDFFFLANYLLLHPISHCLIQDTFKTGSPHLPIAPSYPALNLAHALCFHRKTEMEEYASLQNKNMALILVS